jgi:hypothetical protein
MCALAIYDAWLAQGEAEPETLPDVDCYDWDAIDDRLLEILSVGGKNQ